MSFGLEFFLIIFFVTLNFILFFNLKSINIIVMSLAINILVFIIFLSQIVTDGALFRNISFFLIFYILFNLFLLVNHKELSQKQEKIRDKLLDFKAIFYGLVSFIALFGSFYLISRFVMINLKSDKKKVISDIINQNLNQDLAQNIQISENLVFQSILMVILVFCFLISFITITKSSNRKFFKKIK